MNVITPILPYLLTFPTSLTEKEKTVVKNLYYELGREKIDEVLKKEKQTRPFAAEVLSICDCDSDYWMQVHNNYERRNKSIIEELKVIFHSFHDYGGKTLNVYENFGAVLSSGLTVGNFASGDVDLTVENNESSLAIEVLHNNGYYEENRTGHAKNSDLLITPFYNPNALGGKGYWLNIMRKPIARNIMLKQDRYNNRLSLSRRQKLEEYKDTGIMLLEPTSMVYFNALHFACEHFYSASPGMALCCDMDRVIRTREIDWYSLVKWSNEDNAGLRLRLALHICSYFLKTEVPLNLFKEPSKYYNQLWGMLVDEKHRILRSQEGKMARLTTELLSDDMPMLKSLLSRLWK